MGAVCSAAPNQTAEVVTPKLNLRSHPHRKAKVVAVLKKGDQVPVLSHKNGWIYVSSGNINGYLRNRPIYIRFLPAEDPRLKTAETKRLEIDKKIRAQQKIVARYKKKEANIIQGLNAIDLTLNSTTQKLSALEKEKKALSLQVKAIQTDMDHLAVQIRKNKKAIKKRLVALYKLEQTGKMELLAAAGSLYEFIGRKSALETILTSDDALLTAQTRRIHQQDQLIRQFNEETAKINRIHIKMQDQIRIQKLERKKREALLSDIQTKRRHGLAAITSLKEARENLDITIRKLSKQTKSAVHPLAFSKFKGLLDLPVNGTIATRFGYKYNSRLDVKVFRSGIDIRADRGEPVKAVSAGNVIYSSWFKGYGNMIIIDHGEKFYSVYAHAEELFKKTGDRVERNEVIATVGDTGSLSGPTLHFEIRNHGKPVDPVPWLKTG